MDGRESGLKREAHGEVEPGDDQIDLEGPEVARHDRVGDGGQLLGRDHRHDAGGEHDQDELAAEGGEDRPERGQPHDVPEELPLRQAERRAGLELPGGNGLDAGAHDLRGVGPEVDHHGQERRLVWPQAETDRGEPEIDEEDLHQERRVADGLDVDPGDRARGAPAGDRGQRARHADYQPQRHGQR